MNGADLGPNVFLAMRTIAANEGWTALYRGKRYASLHDQLRCMVMLVTQTIRSTTDDCG